MQKKCPTGAPLMASRDVNELSSVMRQRAHQFIEGCAYRGVTVLVYCTHRSLVEQAQLYRQSRRLATIERKAAALKEKGYPALADLLMDVGPVYGKLGRHVTGAGPGESWHQYREAWDGVPLVGGKAMWSNSAPEWKTYGAVARSLGLYWAGDWRRFREFPHVQLREGGNPLKVLTRREVDQALNPELVIFNTPTEQ